MPKVGETVVNEKGGKQSYLGVRCDLLPELAILEISKVLHRAAEKYGEDNWKDITVDEHVNHCLTHLFMYLSGDTNEDHLSNAACRGLMALHMSKVPADGGLVRTRRRTGKAGSARNKRKSK